MKTKSSIARSCSIMMLVMILQNYAGMHDKIYVALCIFLFEFWLFT